MASGVVKRYFNLKILSQIIAVILVFSMTVGCQDGGTESGSENTSTISSYDSSTDSNIKDSSSVDEKNESISDSVSDDIITDNNSSNNIINNSDSEATGEFLGEFSFEETVSNINGTNEIIPKGNTANLNKPLKGYVDKKAEKLRKEILNTENTEEYYAIKGTKYYISSVNGDDMNSGTSPEKALKSIEGLSKIELKSGDAVLFERDSVFRIYTTFLTADGVTYIVENAKKTSSAFALDPIAVAGMNMYDFANSDATLTYDFQYAAEYAALELSENGKNEGSFELDGMMR